MKDIVIVAGKRTPMGEYGGALRDFTALELGAFAAKAAIDQSKFEPATSITAFSGMLSRPAATLFTALVTLGFGQDFRSRFRH